MLIRPASVADAPIIAPFHLDCWNHAYPGIVSDGLIDEVNRGDHITKWRTRLDRAFDTTYLALAGGSVVGLATVGPNDQPPPAPQTELRSLYVAASRYGTGLARRLVDAALGDRPAVLWTFEGNDRALAFYRKTGWQPTGERRFDPRGNVTELRLARPGRAG